MDRRRALALGLIAVAASAAAAPGALPIAEARWLAPEHLVADLTTEPAQCLSPSDAARPDVAIGRAAFGAPLLLGGQAARAGLSCASCHRAGRDNPHFRFPGLSGADGTADVTHSLMSSHRGDGNFNPKPIPDLAGPRAALKVSHDPAKRTLETFIRGLVVEEFDGSEPPSAVLAGLAAYVRALDPATCAAPVARTLPRALAEVDEALAAADTADADTARVLIGAARSGLGRIDERFRLDGLEKERALLARADADLRAARDGPDATLKSLVRQWRTRWKPGLAPLRRAEGRSLYAPAVLKARISVPRTA